MELDRMNFIVKGNSYIGQRNLWLCQNSHWKYFELIFGRRECMYAYQNARTLRKRAMLSLKQNGRRDAVVRYRIECASHSHKRVMTEITGKNT